MPNPWDTLYWNLDFSFEGRDNDNTGGFLPATKLEKLVTTESVKPILENLLDSNDGRLPLPEGTSKDAYIDDLTAFATDRASKIFAILIMMEAPWHIQRFYSRKLGHTILPVMRKRTESGIEVRSCSEQSPTVAEREVFRDVFFVNGEPVPGAGGLPGWGYAAIGHFCSHQWAFLSPVLDHGVFRRDVWSKAPMPYTTFSPPSEPQHSILKADGRIDHGNTTPGNSEVEHRCIYYSHLRFKRETTTCLDAKKNYRVAVKVLKISKMTRAEMKHEIDILETVSDKKRFGSDHIVRAIGSVEQSGQPSILFPWAERGNLQHFWRDESEKIKPGSAQFPELLVSVLEQLAGLAGAVAEMHNANIRHGDIKPSNILCFEERTKEARSCMQVRMVLTDVGTAKDHLSSTTHRRRQNMITGVNMSTTRYAAPELQEVLNTDESSGVISRKFDVWSLGCVYMEFLVWLLYGQEGQVQFMEESDTFFAGSGAAVDKTVSTDVNKWIHHMDEKDGRCPANTALGALITLIREKLLVIYVKELHQDQLEAARQPPKLPTIETAPPRTGSFFAKLRLGRKSKKSSQTASPSPTPNAEAATTTAGSEVKYRISATDTESELRSIKGNLEGGHINASGDAGSTGGCASRPSPKPIKSKTNGTKGGM